MKGKWRKITTLMLVLMLVCQSTACNKKTTSDSTMAQTTATVTGSGEVSPVPEETDLGEGNTVGITELPEETDPGKAGFMIYRGKGFTLSYPDTWKRQDLIQDGFGICPKDLEDDDYAENVMVVTKDLSEYSDINLEKFKKMTLEEFEEADEFEVVSCKKTTFGGLKAYKLLLKSVVEDMNFKSLQIFTVVGNTGYIFGFSGDEEGFSKYMEDTETILSTFQFAGSVENEETQVPSATP